MYDYANLPTLVLNEIFGYLSVKERIKAKSVCRIWRAEIELRERKRDTLVLHRGPYSWNKRWSETNNRRLMKFENSFEVRRLTFLEHPMTRELLKKTKKLAFLSFYNFFDLKNSTIEPYLRYFENCEEIEIRSYYIEGTLTFALPKLKVLVIKDSTSAFKLVLNCPSLEVLCWNSELHEIHFENAKKLKRLICFGWPTTVYWHFDKLSSLRDLNLFTSLDDVAIDRLLERMPNLKRFVLYSSNPQAYLESIREQQKRLGLKNLEILFNGFRHPVGFILDSDSSSVMLNWSLEQLYENYPKLVENLPWKFCINYSQLFNKFKILPSDFFERFSEPLSIEISEVTNYTHLLGFLKCYPSVHQLRIHSKVKIERILDLAHSCQPSLSELTIVAENPSDLLEIDLSFLRLFNLAQLGLETTRLPVEFLRKVAAKRGAYLHSILFRQVLANTSHLVVISLYPQGPLLIVYNRPKQYSTIEQLIADMQSRPDLSTILL